MIHRGLSFGNVRLERTRGEEMVVKLIDVDLLDQIENLDSVRTAPNRTATIRLKPIEILETTKPPPPRQE